MTTFPAFPETEILLPRRDLHFHPAWKCSRCGECCKWTYIGLRQADYHDNEMCEALMRRGLRIFNYFGGCAVIRAPCMHLVEMPDGLYACSLQQAGRKPNDCVRYTCELDPIMKVMKLAKAINECNFDLRQETQEEDARDIAREILKLQNEL